MVKRRREVCAVNSRDPARSMLSPLKRRHARRFALGAWHVTAKGILWASMLSAVVLLAGDQGAWGASSFANWLSGAKGYEQALEQRGASRAILLYFYTDWCPYCQRFNREIVPSAEMHEYLRHAIAVRVNPETGTQERALAAQFRVSGYPTIFVIPPGTDRPQEMAVSRDSPAEFVAACEAAGNTHRDTLSAGSAPSRRPVGTRPPFRATPQKPRTSDTPRPVEAKNLVHLNNGNVLAGTVRQVNDTEIVLEVDGIGRLRLNRAEISTIDGALPAPGEVLPDAEDARGMEEAR